MSLMIVEQRFAAAANDFGVFLLLALEFGVSMQQIRHSDNGVHRRANFVAHARQKRAFGAVGGFGGFLGLTELVRGFGALAFVTVQFGEHSD